MEEKKEEISGEITPETTTEATVTPKVRKPTRVPNTVVAARKKEKAVRTEIKKTRQKPEILDS